MVDSSDKTKRVPGRFPTTRWSLFEAVRAADPEQKRDVLHHLIQNYWNPIYVFIRRYTQTVEEAEDFTQEFLADWLTRDLFALANPSKGRFRSFLQKSIKNFLVDKHRFNSRQRRHPLAGFTQFTLETDEQSSDGDDPEKALMRAFVSKIIHQTLSALERACQPDHYYLFQRRVVEPILDGAQPVSVEQLAADLGFSTQKAYYCLRETKKAYQKLLRQEVSKYAINTDDLDREMANILTLLYP